MNKLTRLIRNDCKPSLGVTEPGAIALAVAAAKKRTRGTVREIHLALNSGMYKNAFTCGIPGTREVGFLWAAALGAVAGKAEKELEALENIDETSVSAAKALLDAGAVTAEMTGIDSEIYIRADVKTELDVCSVTIRHTHTNIVSIVLNGEELLEPVHETRAEEAAAPEIHGFSFEALVSYAKTVPIEEISFLREAFSMNLALLEEGLRDARTVVAHHLFEKNGKTLLSSDTWSTAQLLCAGAIEARVLGAGAPAMSITGSGSHGIIAVMPLYAAAKAEGYAEEALLRAAALSMLVTQYIKEYSGRLSAMCGCGVAAGTGMACGLCMLRGGSLSQISMTLRNMALSITGMICDGGNHGCALKAVAATDAAFRACELALCDVSPSAQHGIAGRTPEETMRDIGYISSPGMQETERAIVEIFAEKSGRR